jgi:hypothetical protein
LLDPPLSAFIRLFSVQRLQVLVFSVSSQEHIERAVKKIISPQRRKERKGKAESRRAEPWLFV